MGRLVQAFKEKFSRISPSNTSTTHNECMDTPLSNVQELRILKSLEEIENELKIENKALLTNFKNEEPEVDELKVGKESQVMAIENVLLKIDTFTFPMDFVTWGIEGDHFIPQANHGLTSTRGISPFLLMSILNTHFIPMVYLVFLVFLC